MYLKIIFFLFSLLLMISCGGDNSSSPDVENSSNSHSLEIPCDATNEGTIIKPTDSDVEHICKDGSWIAIGSSSSSNNIITNETKQSSSSSSYNVILSASEESSSSSNSVIGSETNPSSSLSSSVIASETKQSSSSSSSEDFVESSSSEETKLYLCEDGETYVLDPANCEKISSSSVVVSSSSDNKLISSSNEIQESSSSEMSSSSEKIDSSSSTIESSSSNISSSSIDESSSSEESSSSLNDDYDANNNTLTDPRDGQIYKTVTIGSQVWMAENLNYLPEDTVGTIWAGKSVCGGGNWKSLEEGDCSIFGRLYEEDFTKMEEYIDSICPNGWSLPSKKQYENLISFLGEDANNKMKIANSIYWNINDSTNQSGFSAIPAGYYSSKGFNYLNKEGVSVASFAFVSIGSNARNVISIQDDESDFWWSSFNNYHYMSVRCIKD